MSSLEGVNPFAVESPASAAANRWQRVDAIVSRLSERLNPILVKEARQALKSKQFLITFTLVLFFGWTWSMFGVSLFGPSVYYGAEGANMFIGYFPILAFPLLIIVPVGAFWSLVEERQDWTFELLSITSLRSWQIISGKLGSAILQMVVYLSAMAPCLAFTYLLRGIDLPTILLVLVYVFLASVGLSLLGLLLATLIRERLWRIVLLVFLIVGLMYVFVSSWVMVVSMLEFSQMAFDQAYFWIGNAAVLSVYFSYFALCYCVAAGQLTFSSENRSTPSRIVMLVQQALFFGWMVWTFAEFPEGDMWYAFVTISGLHWYVMGVFLTAESPELSSRVQRRLPQSFLGRLFLSWFNPGPGTGYIFVLANLAAALIVAAVCLSMYQLLVPSASGRFGINHTWVNWGLFAVLGYCYVTIYLGVGKLMIDFSRRYVEAGVVLSLLVQVLLLLAGSLVPLTIHLISPTLRGNYALLEITNPFWTLYEVGAGTLGKDNLWGIDQTSFLILTLVPAAALLTLIHLRGVVEEVRKVRVAAPQRVAEEDAQRQALLHPPTPVQISPWDFSTPQ